MPSSQAQRIIQSFEESAQTLRVFGAECADSLVALARDTAEVLRAGGKVLVFGNGGSAADAQHLAAEFVNRYQMDRPPLPAIALTTDSSALTAIGNDFGFDQVFEKPVQALARRGDVVVGISTSGRSPNVVRAMRAAQSLGCLCVALVGEGESSLGDLCRYVFRVPSKVTPRVQECHIAWVHSYCDLVDRILFPLGAE